MFTPNNQLTYEPIKNEEHSFLTEYDLGGNTEKNIVRQCFNEFYQEGILLEIIYSILVEYEGGGMDYFYWLYPDIDSPFSIDHFEGVSFQIGINNPNTTVYLTEQVHFNYSRIACNKFIDLHPEYKSFLYKILDDWIPLNH